MSPSRIMYLYLFESKSTKNLICQGILHLEHGDLHTPIISSIELLNRYLQTQNSNCLSSSNLSDNTFGMLDLNCGQNSIQH